MKKKPLFRAFLEHFEQKGKVLELLLKNKKFVSLLKKHKAYDLFINLIESNKKRIEILKNSSITAEVSADELNGDIRNSYTTYGLDDEADNFYMFFQKIRRKLKGGASQDAYVYMHFIITFNPIFKELEIDEIFFVKNSKDYNEQIPKKLTS